MKRSKNALFICHGTGNLQRLAQKLHLSSRLDTKESPYDAKRRRGILGRGKGRKKRETIQETKLPKLAKTYPSVHACLTKSTRSHFCRCLRFHHHPSVYAFPIF